MRLLLIALLPALGCTDTSQCEAFATHVADVVTRENAEPVDAEIRDKMVKQTVDACAADPPSKEALACALAAESSEAMKACDEIAAE
jgi:hypothetical protein